MAYNKIQDLLDLVFWMQSKTEGVSIEEIMAKYNVSKRTAFRMKDLIKEKFPQLQETKNGYKKRWFIPQGQLNHLVTFSLDEVNALQNSIKQAKNNSSVDVEFLESLMCKIKASMTKDVRNRIEPDAEALLEAEGYVFRPGPKIKANKEFILKLRLAILSCLKIRIKYSSSRDKGWRNIEPYGFLYGNKQYLIAWYSKKNAMCHFDLNKISEIEVLDEYFERRTDFSLQDFSEQSFGVYQEEPFDVEWLFDKEVASEAEKYVFHPKQEAIKNDDGTLTVKFHAGGAREMDWHLYTWGDHVKVIKPKNFDELRKWKD